MPDKILPTREVFEKVNVWNTDADVYKHGSLHQQALKVYRYLGQLAEGVQKMDHLAIAAATGNYMINLYSTLAFVGIKPGEFDCAYVTAPLGRDNTPVHHMVHLLMTRTTQVISMADQYDSPAGSNLMRGVLLGQLNDTMALLKAIANKSGFYIERTVVNAGNVLLSKKGKLDEFGLFYADKPVVVVAPVTLTSPFDGLDDVHREKLGKLLGVTPEQMGYQEKDK
ncbi:hypothetical protein BIZ78_gp039 [Erwinia phage vB_EamM_Caitlin]|uniref:hypothetical protein n=1 Tax=Erwinia phage vB_EamM_Caitlin TaxID=1883379 RepID=UPI00081C8986|nr:hypothetical protein BIZ78_gp039 [Erwinia phage vB_EamM_Caitlin]ANZ48536.1 hypothetical protein CAITLIN_241 [Erwinia phage vB_EamM_Caitlin]